ncbi:MAG: ABC transporter ATP-binding protein [Treponema sp.]|nr:ABC transporter ATP-binding protein [Treponema sp.]
MLNRGIRVSEFSKKYNEKFVCKSIDLVAEENQVTGILGANGAGKTTLLRAIGQQLYGTCGTITVNGIDHGPTIRGMTGFVPEVPDVDLNLTVREILYFESILFSDDGKASEEKIEFAVKTCGLEEHLPVRASRLSKGYRQRLSLACALCHDPSILILDEFTDGLDPVQNAFLLEKICRLKEGRTVLFSTHRLEEAEEICDCVYVLSHGEIAAHGSPQEIAASLGCRSFKEAFVKLS